MITATVTTDTTDTLRRCHVALDTINGDIDILRRRMAETRRPETHQRIRAILATRERQASAIEARRDAAYLSSWTSHDGEYGS